MKQKGVSSILVAVVIGAVVVLALILMFALKGGTSTSQQLTPATQTSEIQNSSDLDAAASDLDATNVDSTDGQLTQIDQDASTF